MPIIPFVAFHSILLLAVAPCSDICTIRWMSTSHSPPWPFVLSTIHHHRTCTRHSMIDPFIVWVPSTTHRRPSTSHNNLSLIKCRWPYSHRRPSTGYVISVAPSTIYAIPIEMVPPSQISFFFCFSYSFLTFLFVFHSFWHFSLT